MRTGAPGDGHALLISPRSIRLHMEPGSSRRALARCPVGSYATLVTTSRSHPACPKASAAFLENGLLVGWTRSTRGPSIYLILWIGTAPLAGASGFPRTASSRRHLEVQGMRDLSMRLPYLAAISRISSSNPSSRKVGLSPSPKRHLLSAASSFSSASTRGLGTWATSAPVRREMMCAKSRTRCVYVS